MKRVFAFIGFSVAITLIVLNLVSFKYSYIVLFVAVTLFLASLLFKSLRKAGVVPVVLGSVAFASCIFIVAYTGAFLPQSQLSGQVCQSRIKIISVCEETSGGYTCVAKTESINAPDAPQNIKVKLNCEADLGIDYYTDFDATVQFYSIADTAFESYSYFGDNIFLTARIISVDQVYEQEKTPGYYFLEIRQSVLKILEQGFSGDVLGLASGILLGDKIYLSDNVVDGFQVCGTSHIIAVSGLHISVICLCLYNLLKLFDCSKSVRIVVSLTVLFVYSGVVGFPKSVLRAGIMLTVILISKLFNQKGDTLNSLGIAVFIMCLNPFAVSDVSALLTVTAVLGILVITPQLEVLLNVKNKVLKYLWNSVCISLGVLFSTMPVMWFVFGQISLISILLNILVVPLVQVALVAVALYVLFFGIPFLSFIPRALGEFVLNIIIWVNKFCSEKLGFLFLNVKDEIFGVAIFAVLLFVGISLIVTKKVEIKSALVFICAVFAVTGILNMYQVNNNAYVYISQNSVVAFYDRDCCIAIGVNSKDDYYDFSQFKRESNYYIDCSYAECEDGFAVESDGRVSDAFYVDFQGDSIILTVYNKTFKINDDCVIIDNNLFYRNLQDRFSSQDEITLVVAKED